MKQQVKKNLPYIISVAAILILWQILSCITGSSLIVPKPIDVLKVLGKLSTTSVFWENFFETLKRVIIGFVLSMTLGSFLGFICGRWIFAKKFFSVPLTILRATPVVALILILLFILKSNEVPIAVSILMALPVVVSSISSAFEKTKNDLQMFEMARIFKLSKLNIFRFIHIPKTLPFIKSAASSSFGMTWKVVAAGEILCLPRKALGTLLSTAQIHLESEEVFAITISIILACFFLEKLFTMIYKLFSKIHETKKQHALKNISNVEKEKKNLNLMAPEIKIENLNINFGDNTIFQNFSASFASGKITAIVAPSGRGKTTLLNHISKNYKNVSMCFQDSCLFENETALLNISLPLSKSAKQISSSDFDSIKQILRIFGMESKAFSECKTLSGGERQRINLARAILFPSSTLLLDEPFSAIDEKIKFQIMDYIKKMNTESPRTIIFVTHNKSEAEFLADKIVAL